MRVRDASTLDDVIRRKRNRLSNGSKFLWSYGAKASQSRLPKDITFSKAECRTSYHISAGNPNVDGTTYGGQQREKLNDRRSQEGSEIPHQAQSRSNAALEHSLHGMESDLWWKKKVFRLRGSKRSALDMVALGG